MEGCAALRMLPDEQRAARAAMRSADAPVPAALRLRIEVLRPAAALRRGTSGHDPGCDSHPASRPARLRRRCYMPQRWPRAARALARQRPPPNTPPCSPPRSPVSTFRLPGTARVHAAGTRTDKLGGRRTQTVFYDRRGDLVASTIVSVRRSSGRSTGGYAPACASPRRASRSDHRHLATRRTTCVLAGRSVSHHELLGLAVWNGTATGCL
jgi:hypothetical protein